MPQGLEISAGLLVSGLSQPFHSGAPIVATAPCEDPLSPLLPIAGFSLPAIPWSTLSMPSTGDEAMSSLEYSLPDVLDRLHHNQLALEAAVMELTLLVERQGHTEVGINVRGALEAIGENSGHIKQGLARLRAQGPD